MKKRSKCACKVGVLTESSCCDGPPDISILDRLGPPPKPPWISSTDFEAICNNTQYYNPSPGITSPKSDANSTAGHNISSAEIVLISLSLVIVCAVIAALIAYYFYKKRYQVLLKGKVQGKAGGSGRGQQLPVQLPDARPTMGARGKSGETHCSDRRCTDKTKAAQDFTITPSSTKH